MLIGAIMLVVVSAALVFFLEHGSRGVSRDFTRIIYLQKIGLILRDYRAEFGSYPSTLLELSAYGRKKDSGKTFPRNDWPRNPGSEKDDPNAGYLYAVSSDGANYVLGAKLDDMQKELEQLPEFAPSELDGIVYGVNCDDPVYCISEFVAP